MKALEQLEKSNVYRWIVVIIVVASLISILSIFRNKITSWYSNYKLRDAKITKIEFPTEIEIYSKLQKFALGLVVSNIYLSVGKKNGINTGDYFKVVFYKEPETKQFKDYKAMLYVKDVRDEYSIASCLYIRADISFPNQERFEAIEVNDAIELVRDDGNADFTKICNAENEIMQNNYIYHIGDNFDNLIEFLYRLIADYESSKEVKNKDNLMTETYDSYYQKFQSYYSKDEISEIKIKEYLTSLDSFLVKHPNSFWKEEILKKSLVTNYKMGRYDETINLYNLLIDAFPNLSRKEYFERLSTISSLRSRILRNPYDSRIHIELARFISRRGNISVVNVGEAIVEYIFAYILDPKEDTLSQAESLIDWRHKSLNGYKKNM